MSLVPTSPDSAISVLGRSLMTGFRFLAWLNGLGVAVTMLCSMGAIDLGLASAWYRFPLALFLGGLGLAALGLLWSYLLQSSLIHQVMTGKLRRTHWVPLTCTLIAYILSLLAFASGCWFLRLHIQKLLASSPTD